MRIDAARFQLTQFIYDMTSIDATLPSRDTIESWILTIRSTFCETYDATRNQFGVRQSSPVYLASATSKLYFWVRQPLQIPLHKGLIDHLGINPQDLSKRINRTYITRIYIAIRNGEFVNILQDLMSDD